MDTTLAETLDRVISDFRLHPDDDIDRGARALIVSKLLPAVRTYYAQLEDGGNHT